MSTDRPDLADGILRAYLSDNAVGASPEILAAVAAASAAPFTPSSCPRAATFARIAGRSPASTRAR